MWRILVRKFGPSILIERDWTYLSCKGLARMTYTEYMKGATRMWKEFIPPIRVLQRSLHISNYFIYVLKVTARNFRSIDQSTNDSLSWSLSESVEFLVFAKKN